MCSGDASLEPVSLYPNGSFTGGVTGYGATHQCKDWSALMRYAERHRYSDKTGLDEY